MLAAAPPLFHGGVGSACGAAASNWTGELRTCSLMHPVERACEIGSGVGSANKDGGLRERKRTRKADAEWLNRSGRTADVKTRDPRPCKVQTRFARADDFWSTPVLPSAPGRTAGKLIRARPASAGRAPTWTSATTDVPYLPGYVGWGAERGVYDRGEGRTRTQKSEKRRSGSVVCGAIRAGQIDQTCQRLDQ